MPSSYQNPNGFKDFKSRLGKYGTSSNKPAVSWSDIAEQAEIGYVVQALTNEGIAVRFNRSKDKSSCILTLLIDGPPDNLYFENREQWQAFCKDTLD